MINTAEAWKKYHSFQSEESWCGPAVVQMALAAAGISKTQDEIAEYIFKPWWGTSQQLMLSYLSLFFNTVNYKHNGTIKDISFHLNSGHIVIVNFWDNITDEKIGDGHYSIVAECKKGIITFADPSAERDGIWSLTTKEFKPRWYDTIDTQNRLYIEGWLLWVNPDSLIMPQ